LPLGAVSPVPVDFGICTASHKDLRVEVAARRLREDFYFRIAKPDVTIPPLRDRPEEIPVIIAREIARGAPTLVAHVAFVEACLLRRWPGNVRELIAETRAAAQLAVAEASEDVKARHLAPNAGRAFDDEPSAEVGDVGEDRSEPPARGSPGRQAAPDAATLKALMIKHRGVVKDVAAELGCSRRQVGRWLDEHGIDREPFRS
jgi:transcriptional regulator of acetoin/glycerol metabolism